jgi:hypothetical protein
MYEQHTEKLIPTRQFVRRVARHGGLAATVMLLSLGMGILGFRFLADQDWLDAYLNSAMLLSGMGPVGDFKGTSGKVFAGLYALYAGIVFLGATAVFLAPVVHRILHKLRLTEKGMLK